MKRFICLVVFCIVINAQATVHPLTAKNLDDAVTRGIFDNNQIPKTIFEVQTKLEQLGGKLKPHIVANRGHLNPTFGSFSVFHTYSGPIKNGTCQEHELFIGFFTTQKNGIIKTLQSFRPGLMIEIIAWDYTKKVYNFWELVGNGFSSEWHYRGDSNDILEDVKSIYLNGAKKPSFGKKLRCSGCHTQGGPIMKEIKFPYNDWWTKKDKLSLRDLRLISGSDPKNPEHFAAKMFSEATDAKNFSVQVKKGIDQLLDNRKSTEFNTLKHQLRSLVTPMEMNLVSGRTSLGSDIGVPSEFIVDSRLLGKKDTIDISRRFYVNGLEKIRSAFAQNETPGLIDSYQPFLVPARSYIDNKIIDKLLEKNILDEETIIDILAIDFTNPMYSEKRLSLLKYFPGQANSVQQFKNQLVKNLQAAQQDSTAQELLKNITNSSRNIAFHRQKAINLLEICRNAAPIFLVNSWLRLASQRRVEIQNAQTSKNPLGTILEPGFRVIFPQNNLKSESGKLYLNPNTGLAEMKPEQNK
ncbi:hypothetical protein [Candidatus Uabimicrobium sp. HlEnr_7]|uniref:hypothetical protein n=1 Tax=Candidatus Uabimicrobium helgolandensis TaxID=3095367 RepID=UPI0035575A49